jgi:hypothetical protein
VCNIAHNHYANGAYSFPSFNLSLSNDDDDCLFFDGNDKSTDDHDKFHYDLSLMIPTSLYSELTDNDVSSINKMPL